MVKTWLSVSEAAKTTGYSIYHLRDLIKAGKIKARKIVTVWQVDQASLLAYLGQVETLGKKRGPKSKT